jgi:shikimate dehydrogenase
MAERDKYVVIGNPIEHSKSPQIHSMFAEQTGEAIEYKKILCSLGDFSKVVTEFFAAGGLGANVTVPFKLDAYDLATTRSSRAEHAGAANTLANKGGLVLAENTDGLGLVTDIVLNLEFPIVDKSILIVGAGGAARGVLLPLAEERPKRIMVVNRTPNKAHELINSIKTEIQGFPIVLSSGGLHDIVEDEFDLVVNATSSSLSGDAFPLSSSVLGRNALAYDMMYGRDKTSFSHWAAAAKAYQISDGLGMLVEQAAESFFLWRGKRPETRAVMEALRAT